MKKYSQFLKYASLLFLQYFIMSIGYIVQEKDLNYLKKWTIVSILYFIADIVAFGIVSKIYSEPFQDIPMGIFIIFFVPLTFVFLIIMIIIAYHFGII